MQIQVKGKIRCFAAPWEMEQVKAIEKLCVDKELEKWHKVCVL